MQRTGDQMPGLNLPRNFLAFQKISKVVVSPFESKGFKRSQKVSNLANPSLVFNVAQTESSWTQRRPSAN